MAMHNNENFEYVIRVKTGSQTYAGCDNDIQLEIHGTKGNTKLHSLDNFFENCFETGQVDEFKFKDVDVGEIEYVGVLVEKWLLHKDSWYLEYIEIIERSGTQGGPIRFPVYSWFVPCQDVQYFFTNKTCIPQRESDTRMVGNRRTQRTMKSVLNWNEPNDRVTRGFPGYHNEKYLDANLDFTNVMYSSLQKNRKKVINNAIFKSIEDKFKGIKEMGHYLRAAEALNKEFVLHLPWLENDLWKTDQEFGRQTLNGYNPTLIKKCTELPINFAVNDNHLKNLLTRGLSLEEEMASGNIYIIDHRMLEDIPTGYYPLGSTADTGIKMELAAAMCLFYVDSNDDFRPIAIQLGQTPGPEFPIWTPNDAECDWLLAKMWFRNADYQVHQMKSHLALTHLLVEPVAIAMFRCLPPAHPVHKLLREHVQFVIAINTIGRVILLTKGGSSDKVLTIGHGSNGYVHLIEKCFNEFHFENEFDFPTNIALRGVANIPNYHFRDDSMMLWNAICSYVEDILNIFYQTDDEVKNDWEIQEWIKEIHSVGYAFGNSYDDSLRTAPGVPEHFESRSGLNNFLTKIIFQSVVIHIAVNGLQFEYGCFAPNVPSLMKGKIPNESDRGKIDLPHILESLPGLHPCLAQAGVAFALTRPSPDEVFLLTKDKLLPPRWLFTEENAKIAFDKFQSNLQKIENHINERNLKVSENGGIPYEVLKPTGLSYGITI